MVEVVGVVEQDAMKEMQQFHNKDKTTRIIMKSWHS